VNNLEYEEYWAEYKREWLRQNSQMLESDYNNWVVSSCAFYKQQQANNDDPKL
jgi:hypothetical protein